MIKIFEEYNQYYTEIDVIEFLDMIGMQLPNVDAEEETKYSTLAFTDYEINILSRIKDIDISNNNNTLYANISFIYYKNTNPYRVCIYKLPDEWFLIRNSIKYYKCDQMEGLIKCINNL